MFYYVSFSEIPVKTFVACTMCMIMKCDTGDFTLTSYVFLVNGTLT